MVFFLQHLHVMALISGSKALASSINSTGNYAFPGADGWHESHTRMPGACHAPIGVAARCR
jgi:hypothetical protein